MTKLLKDCPMCGNSDMDKDEGCFPKGVNKGWMIQCGNPSCGLSVWHGAKDEAIAAWNNRATDDLALLSLLADIRKAAGDPTGKLMQDELVAHIAALRADAERYRLLRQGRYWSVINGIGDERKNEELDAAIDAKRTA